MQHVSTHYAHKSSNTDVRKLLGSVFWGSKIWIDLLQLFGGVAEVSVK